MTASPMGRGYGPDPQEGEGMTIIRGNGAERIKARNEEIALRERVRFERRAQVQRDLLEALAASEEYREAVVRVKEARKAEESLRSDLSREEGALEMAQRAMSALYMRILKQITGGDA